MVHHRQQQVPSLLSAHPYEYQSKPAPSAIVGAENHPQAAARRQWLPKSFCLSNAHGYAAYGVVHYLHRK